MPTRALIWQRPLQQGYSVFSVRVSSGMWILYQILQRLSTVQLVTPRVECCARLAVVLPRLVEAVPEDLLDVQLRLALRGEAVSPRVVVALRLVVGQRPPSVEGFAALPVPAARAVGPDAPLNG